MTALRRLFWRAVLALVTALALWLLVERTARRVAPAPTTSDAIQEPVAVSQIDAIEILQGKETTSLRRMDGWRLASSRGELLADEAAVEALLARFSSLRLRPVVNPGPESLYGLDQPGSVIRLRARGQLLAELAIGEPAITESARYVRRRPRPGVFLLSSLDLLPLSQGAEGLRERRLLPCPEGEISAVLLRNDAGLSAEVRRETGALSLLQAGALHPADPERAQALFSALAQTRVLRFAPLPAGEPQAASLSLSAGCGRYSVALDLLPTPNGLLARRRLTDPRGSAEEDLVTLPASALTSLSPDVDGLKDQRLLPALDRAPVARIKLRWGEEFSLLNRLPEGSWELLSPRPGPASLARVEALLAELGLLRGARVALASDGAAYQLAAPFGEVELFSSEGASLGHLALSPPLATGGVYAQSLEGGPVVALSQDELARLDLPGWVTRPGESP